MDIQVVQDHHITTPKGWSKLRADVGVESGTIHGPSMIHGATISSQRKPATKVCVCHLPKGVSAMSRSPFRLRPRKGVIPAFAGTSVGLYARLINEDEPRRLTVHKGLATFAPCSAGRLDVRAFFLRRQQRFFYR